MFYTFIDRDGRTRTLNLANACWLEFHDADETLVVRFESHEATFAPSSSDYYALKNLLSGRVAPAPAPASPLELGRA